MAANSLNKVQIIGNLGGAPEQKGNTKEGSLVVNFSVATSEKWKDKQGVWQEKAEWHRITVFGRLAEVAEEYLKKGSKVFVEGKIQYNEYEGKYYTNIIANQMIMLDKKGDTDSSTPSNNSGEQDQDNTKLEEGIPF